MSTKIFTDVVKDVIGNDPVLDQFDVSYVASFYGTSQDDYVTGSFLTRVRDSNGAITNVTGTRGRVFSKWYARNQAAPDTSAVELSNNPSQAFREEPWFEKASNCYRIIQSFDDNERYYDSCPPNPSDCFSTNGASVWTALSESYLFLSPYRNVEYVNIGYMLFNAATITDSNYVSDNDWTWSYPYETKYGRTRILKTTEAFTYVSKIGTNTSPGQEVNVDRFSIVDQTKIRNLRSFLPILPGRLKKEDLAASARNSLRSSNLIPTGSSNDLFGHSWSIPCDVTLNNIESHVYLNSWPAVTSKPVAAPITGSSNLTDTIKFLFGFGDLNNVSYGYTLDKTKGSSSYKETFESYSAGTTAQNVSSYATSDKYLNINWTHSPTSMPWRVVAADGTLPYSGGVRKHFISGSLIRWISGSYPSNTKILVSDTDPVFGGNIGDTSAVGYASSSIAIMDVTSSNPWTIAYKRIAACHKSDLLYTYFSATPNSISSSVTDEALQAVPHEFLTGSVPIEVLSGSAVVYPTNDNTKQDTMTVFTSSIVYPPGEYRINFAFLKSGSTESGHETLGGVDRAAIDDVNIITWNSLNDNEVFSFDYSGARMGSNCYPKFHKMKVDTRYNPIASGTVNQVTGTQNDYQGYNFCLAPIIRGWKYGIYSGFPAYTKAIFRRDHFGHPRDMLEQRQYTKFIYASPSPQQAGHTTTAKLTSATTLPSAKKFYNITAVASAPEGELGPPVVEAKFVKQRYVVDGRGIGAIVSDPVNPIETHSANLSTEVTSSMPYFDGVARHRTSYPYSLTSAGKTVASVGIDSNGNITVT